MSTTAVLISGQMRTFAQCLPTLQWACFRKLQDPRFFISAANDEQAADAQLIHNHYDDVSIEVVDQPTLPEPDAKLADHAPYAISVKTQSILRQAWHLKRVYEFAMQNGADKCDTFIRCRPDLWMTDCGEVDTWADIQCLLPWWGRFAGANDRFAIMGAKAAPHYFGMFDQIDALLADGCPFHPESLLLAALEKAGVETHHTLNAVFSTLRMPEPDPLNPGQMRQERRLPEIQAQEIAEYARASR